ncbi:hypothetical protein Q5752_002451 [Cryptotrichosporon argae]
MQTSLRSSLRATRALPRPAAQPRAVAFRRSFADAAHHTPPPPPPPPSGGADHTQMYVILGALAALAGGGYYYLKPVRDVAAVTHSAINSASQSAGDYADTLAGVAKSMLPPGAFAIYNQLASQPGGLNGLLSSLKDKDVQGVLDEIKKAGGDDVKRVVEKVEKKVKEANGSIDKVDWKALAQELKGELGEKGQHAVDLLIGQLPSKENIDQLINKAKAMGEDQLKQVEQAASKILQEVEKARKEGKDKGDAFLKGLKTAAPGDIDDLITKLKDAAKKAGLPADTAESWLKAKAEDGKVNAEEAGKQVKDKLRQASKLLPEEPKDLVKQVEQFSPSVAKLLQQAMEEAGVVDEKGNRK